MGNGDGGHISWRFLLLKECPTSLAVLVVMLVVVMFFFGFVGMLVVLVEIVDCLVYKVFDNNAGLCL